MNIHRNQIIPNIEFPLALDADINPKRIYDYSSAKIKDGDIFYLMQRDLRLDDNDALKFAVNLAQNTDKNLKIIVQKPYSETNLKKLFFQIQIYELEMNLKKHKFDYQIYDETFIKKHFDFSKIGALVIDFNPIDDKKYLKNCDCKIFEVDTHNIIPARYVSEKQEYNAATLRRKIYFYINEFLTLSQNSYAKNSYAQKALSDFIKYRLQDYAEFKNDPQKQVLSGLSKFLNLGFLSSKSVVQAVLEANVTDKNKDAFLEELIVRKELADNFCLYNPDFKSVASGPSWGVFSLNKHNNDMRTYIYTRDEFEHALTHDDVWNACQRQLVKEGTIHGYLRMYWAKMILQWALTYREAFDIAIYLNDKYAVDAPSSNGYVGVLWSMTGLHDRPFVEKEVSGKIRTMTQKNLLKKYNLENYLKRYDII